jgi:hypothetical protein
MISGPLAGSGVLGTYGRWVDQSEADRALVGTIGRCEC